MHRVRLRSTELVDPCDPTSFNYPAKWTDKISTSLQKKVYLFLTIARLMPMKMIISQATISYQSSAS